ncbi:MAG: inositol monophosphatase [Proteobacteria bacterium]|nr:inositol monophosphatase [Pseudomonadota bacterium]
MPMRESLERIILEAGKLALRYFDNLDSIRIERKGSKDLVTEADIEVEKFIRERLLELFPGYGFLGEESDEIKGTEGRWIVDPIDGTHSFVHGQYFWSISIALETDGDIRLGAVYAPLLDDLFLAEKGHGAWKNARKIRVSKTDSLKDAMVTTGFACLRSDLKANNLDRFARIASHTMDQRRFGSAALDLCLVADGQVDAFWEQHLNLYDVAAGVLIASEAGASVSDFSGKAVTNPEQILVTNGKILSEILRLM